MAASHDQAIAVRESGCQRAFGAGVFCTCLMKSLPVAWSFPDYIFITTRSKEENGYADMPPDMKQAYDMVAPIRNRCVNQAAR
ncbi:hypothetical protein [Variovorax ginsengisoli]|uniref:Uncharacterized protein n=1 Tax=Variovorax ginsengisoli TaxID=363844 RepID=A0ABT8SGT1_9BURK|nr:hypothetical protein [Variovorax ginsengisoli]MDN8618924.1 hypothetical protein [Variovorax ginsengisoli]MDO1538094.1 hypothetical protein [Variovorax ginsengisoli]